MLTSLTQPRLSQTSAREAPILLGWYAPHGMEASLPVTPLIAQQFEDNLGNNFQSTLNNFVESGQGWALLIGLVLGYAIRSLTAY